MNKIHILDSIFSHAKSTSLDNTPEMFEWVWSPSENLTVFSDNHVNIVDSIKCEKKIAWLIESPCLTKSAYNYVKNNSQKFERIFTFDKDILNDCKNSDLVPIGGCWILDKDIKIYTKTKNVSIISSEKKFLEGHRLRHEVIDNVKNLDVFGRGYSPISNKIEGLKDYRFSIVIENCKMDYYFTEKLIDCFATGTIPIYWGCPSIGDFFDTNGIITFNNIDELKIILNNLEGEYEKRLPSIKKNFELSQKYLVADNLIYNLIIKLDNEKNNFL